MGIVLIVVVCAVLVFLLSPPRSDSSKSRNEDREPQMEDFTTDIDYKGKTALQKFNEAHHEWVQRRIRRIVYELPLEEILKLDDLDLYLMETSKRNRDHIRDEGNPVNIGDEHCPRCQVCGTYQATAQNEFHITLCQDCHTRLASDSHASSDYRLPSGATEFSAELWVRHMVISLDLETGVIDETQAQRELRIIVELERRRIKQEEQRQQREADKKRKEEQKFANVANAANRLR